MTRFFFALVAGFAAILPPSRAAASFELKEGDRVVFLGDTLMEREQHHGYIELMLTARFPDRNVTFRNLGWSADLPNGESRLGLSLSQAGHEPPGEAWKLLQKQITETKPTVVLIGYGMAASFAGEAGLPRFQADYNRLLDTIGKLSPGARFVLLSPIRHEALPAPLPDPARHNEQLKLYTEAIRKIAEQRGSPFVNLFNPAARPKASGPLTDNGIHLNAHGYRLVALTIEHALFGSYGEWASKPEAEPLRQVILRKNEFYFYRSRPANMAYIFGFRRGEQGRNSVEMPQFDPLIALEEGKIAKLRGLTIDHPGPDLQPAPLREQPAAAKPTPQPHPKLIVADGFEATLWAEDPALAKPIQMNFDPQGRLWIASSEVYPQIEPGQAANDKILILEDTNGDGKADRSTVFAEGLLIPTGIEPGDGGCYVAQSTELLHFKDTHGTGQADERHVVLSSFGTEDTHHNLHTLRWGPDGRLWMNQSIYTRSEIETPHGVVRLRSGGIFRFDPRSQDLEIVFRGWVNPWGHQFDEFGQSFVTDGAGGAGINWGLPGAMYTTYAGARRTLSSVSPGGYPKFASIEIVRTPQFPEDWQGRIITCDFRANRVTTFSISEQGAGYITKQENDLLRSANTTFRPIDVKIGPDGALYVADWSNPIINHGEVDFRDPRRDHEHGRIWRVTAQGRPLLEKPDLVHAGNTALLDELLSPSSYNRAQARRVLQERGDSVLKDLAAWTRHLTDEQSLLEALWMHQVLNHPNPELLRKLLAAKDGRIRAAATRVLGDWRIPTLTADASGALPADGTLAQLATLVADEHPRVRVEALRVLARIPSPQSVGLALSVLDKPMDPFLDYALWLSINDLASTFLAALESGAWLPDTPAKQRQLDYAMRAIEPGLAGSFLAKSLTNKPLARDGSGPWIELIGTSGGVPQLSKLFQQAVGGGFNDAATARALTALNDAARYRGARPSGDLSSFGALLDHPSPAVRLAAIRLAGAYKNLGPHLPKLTVLAANVNTPSDLRMAAFESLREIGGPAVVEALAPLTASGTPAAVRREAAVVLTALQPDRFAPVAIEVLATASEADALDLWRQLLASKGAAKLLASQLDKVNLPPAVAQAGLRAAREGGQPEPTLLAALTKQAQTTPASSSEVIGPERMQEIVAAVAKRGNAARGELIFRRPQLGCTLCHSIGGVGGKVGPDMSSLGASAPMDYLVESVLQPNAKIKEGFHSITVETKDDFEYNGIVIRETGQELLLHNAQNQDVSIPKTNIRRRANGLSLMPSGLTDTLPEQERLDLFRFLGELGKQGDYDASQGGVARVWQILPATPGLERDGLGKVVNGDVKDGWKLLAARVNGALAREDIEELAREDGKSPVAFYAATQFNVVKAGQVTFELEGAVEPKVWIDGHEVKNQGSDGSRSGISAALQPGLHGILLRLEARSLPEDIKLKCGDVNWLLN
jgi:putative heme-binding domain-containing protein